jgi:hypothetical protein
VRFYLGTHKAQHLARTAVPLFLSRRVLAGRRSFPRALGPWALDSGGYTELGTHGRWTLDAAAYAAEVRRFAEEVGRLEWVASRDYLCVPPVLEAAGLDVAGAQAATIRNLLEDRQELGELVRPVLQGWTPTDYLRHRDAYAAAGVELSGTVLVGSIAARDDDPAVEWLVRELAGDGLELHGLGVKEGGLARYADQLASADSLAWSRKARQVRGPSIPGHAHGVDGAGHCGNCLEPGLLWRERLLHLIACQVDNADE